MSSKTTINLEVISEGNNKYTVKMDKPVCSEIKFPCIKIIIAIFVISILVGIATIGCQCWFGGESKVEIVIRVALVLAAIVVTLIFTVKALKPYAKMAFLGEVINIAAGLECPKDCNSQDNAVNEKLVIDKDLIKKFCDTLAEL
ncbi:MAG: hypothetical protein K2N31_08125 [Treponemataceae bacterium]|nr:hypothetical protein [Treponemataceae bacterium]